MHHNANRNRPCRRALATFLLLLGSSTCWATVIGPLDTSSPRATFSSFLEWTRTLEAPYGNYLTTPNRQTQRALLHAIDQGLYLLDLSEAPPAARRAIGVQALASIWRVVARVPLPRPEDIPDASAFAQDGPLAGQPAKWRLPRTGIVIQRVDDGPQAGEFLISPRTVASSPQLAEAMGHLPVLRQEPFDNLARTMLRFSGWMLPPRFTAELPEWSQEPVAGQVVWKWFVVTAMLVLSALALILVARWSRRRDWDGRTSTLLRRLTAPATLLALALLLRYFLSYQIQTTGAALVLPEYVAELGTGVALIWMVLLLTAWVPGAVIGMSRVSAKSLDASLIRLVARVISVIAICIFAFMVAHQFGIPVYGLVAGAGVGGLAIALAARPTLENFIGAMNLLADRPIRVGDLCRFDERHGQGWNPVGTVEEIGLRSTKIRQFDRSLITIPNADLAERNIVNLSACETFLLQQRFGLRYETGDDQLRYVLTRLRELLHGHPKTIHTAANPIRVRFLGFRDHELVLEMRAYLRTNSYPEFLAIQEDILLRVMRLLKQAGTGFALPSQTLYMARDDGIDSAAREAAEKRVREWASAQELPFPDLSEAHRKRIADTLDFPPEGSPGADRG